jgi:hypothetical protein
VVLVVVEVMWGRVLRGLTCKVTPVGPLELRPPVVAVVVPVALVAWVQAVQVFPQPLPVRVLGVLAVAVELTGPLQTAVGLETLELTEPPEQ